MQNWLSRNLGYMEVILAGVGFGFLGIFGRLAFAQGMTLGELLTYRFSMAAVLLWVGLFLFKPSLLKMTKKQALISILLGLFGYAVFSTLYFKSLQGVSVAVAAMLLFTFPIFVNLGAIWFLGHRMKPLQWLSLFISCAGLVLLLWGEFQVRSYWSVFYGLGAAITYAIYVLVSDVYQKNIQPLTSSVVVISATSVALWIYHQPDLARIGHMSTIEYFIILGISTISTIVPLTMFLSGMQRIASSKASIIVMIEPVTAAFAGWLILGESLQGIQAVGSTLVLIGVLLSMLRK